MTLRPPRRSNSTVGSLSSHFCLPALARESQQPGHECSDQGEFDRPWLRDFGDIHGISVCISEHKLILCGSIGRRERIMVRVYETIRTVAHAKVQNRSHLKRNAKIRSRIRAEKAGVIKTIECLAIVGKPSQTEADLIPILACRIYFDET